MDDETKTQILLCGDWKHGAEVAPLLGAVGAEAQVVPDLCGRPERITGLLASRGVNRLVLGLCPGEYTLAEVQAEARKAGVDALGVEIVHLRGSGLEKTRLLLAGAVAKVTTYEGSKPENAKLCVSSRISRRSLFRLSVSEYRTAPSIERSRCAANQGCKACVQACPAAAVKWSGGEVRLDKARCEPCGLCVVACPREAVNYPSCTPAQLAAQVTTLLSSEVPGARGIVFTCRHSRDPKTDEGWMPVELPCVGMASATWLLAPLLMGAHAVRVMPCVRECPVGQSASIGGRVAFCQRFLRSMGAADKLVALGPALDPVPPRVERRAPLDQPFRPQARATVLMRLAQAHGVSEFALEHPGSPLGAVEIRSDACTGCGACARDCPSGALAYEKEGNAVALTFDPSKCAACGQCLPKCPEARHDAITLSRAVSLARIREGRRPIHREESARCVACGAHISGVKMMKRVRGLLGGESSPAADLLSSYCHTCRGAGAFLARAN